MGIFTAIIGSFIGCSLCIFALVRVKAFAKLVAGDKLDKLWAGPDPKIDPPNED